MGGLGFFFFLIEMFFLFLREEKSPAKLIKKITCYRLGDPDGLFQVREGSLTWQKWSVNKERNSGNVITRHVENGFQGSLFKIRKH